MKICHALAGLVLLSGVVTSNAADYRHKESGLQFSLPKGWTCTEEGDRITITNKDKTLACVGGVIPKESAKAIFKDINAFLEKLDGFDDVDVTEGPEKENVNGLEQAWYAGTANIKGANGQTEEV